jgi:integrase
MSLEKRWTSKGEPRYVVRYKDAGRHRARSFTSHADARQFDAEVTRRRRLGSLGMLARGRTTLRALRAEWWPRQSAGLSPKSVEMADGAWRTYVEPGLGDARLDEITPEVVERFAHGLLSRGVGETVVEKCWNHLRQMLGGAHAWGWIPSNPAATARKPRKRRTRAEQVALSPADVERVCQRLPRRDAVLVRVMGYAGCRPGEAVALRWGDVDGGRLLVERSLTSAGIAGTKTGRKRRVALPGPLDEDLRRWRDEQGDPPDDAYVFPGLQEPESARNWRRRTFRAAAEKAGLPSGVRPYSLRHGFASGLIAQGMNVVEVAAAMGNSPQMCLKAYAHMLDGYEPGSRVDFAEEIRRAMNPFTRRGEAERARARREARA